MNKIMSVNVTKRPWHAAVWSGDGRVGIIETQLIAQHSQEVKSQARFARPMMELLRHSGRSVMLKRLLANFSSNAAAFSASVERTTAKPDCVARMTLSKFSMFSMSEQNALPRWEKSICPVPRHSLTTSKNFIASFAISLRGATSFSRVSMSAVLR